MTAVDGRQTEMMRETVPFAGALGVEVVESGPQAVRARVEWRPERCTAGGVLHGGVIMGLADTTGAAGRAVAKVLQTQAVLRG
jgi:1,4-dihydroxy-2-naphthoyl-CoA hydrolase